MRTCLTSRGILWVDDPSNRNLAYERVRVRAQLDGHADLKARILTCQARLQDVRRLEERLIGRWMADCVAWDGEGGARLNLSRLPRERLERALGLMLQIVGGKETPPRRDAVQPLAGRLSGNEAFQGATLGGVLIYRKQGDVVLSAEPGIAGMAADPALARARFDAMRALYVGDT